MRSATLQSWAKHISTQFKLRIIQSKIRSAWESCVLGCDAVSSGQWLSTSEGIQAPPSSVPISPKPSSGKDNRLLYPESKYITNLQNFQGPLSERYIWISHKYEIFSDTAMTAVNIAACVLRITSYVNGPCTT